jgi:hypothetical protein
MTAAAPAVNAKHLPEERLSKALAELVVLPMTCLSASVASARLVLTGERSGVVLRYGELDGVSFKLPPHAGLMILGWDGVSDIACAHDAEKDAV